MKYSYSISKKGITTDNIVLPSLFKVCSYHLYQMNKWDFLFYKIINLTRITIGNISIVTFYRCDVYFNNAHLNDFNGNLYVNNVPYSICFIDII